MDNLEQIFNINIENAELFKKALTHPSYPKEQEMDYTESYERLEFLGDAVLKLAVSDILYKKYPDYTEGSMSKIRSIIVSDAVLFEVAEKIGLSELIILGKHEEKQGCRKLESVCACAFEAVLGAYYLDGKFSELIEFIKRIFLPYIEEVDKNFEKYNAKALLQEYTQSKTKTIPEYRIVTETGPAHNKTFEVEVWYEGELIACACGKSKKDAEQKCAYEACKKLGIAECQK